LRIVINDKEIIFPSSLSEITLGQRINFQKQYGDLLDKMLESCQKMEDPELREIELVMFQMEKMYATFAFFAGCTLEAIKESEFVGRVAQIYSASLHLLFEEEENMELQSEFLWRGEEWELAAPTLSNGSNMSFGELIQSKQLMQDMVALGRNRWDALQSLAAIYFRKKGEAYSDKLVEEGSERLALMLELPMDYALQVGFFLSALMNSSVNILMSSENPGPSQRAVIRGGILKRMAG